MTRHNLWPGDQDRQHFDLTRHVGENTASLRSLEKSVERVQGQLDGVEQVVAGLPGEMSGKLAEAIRAEVAPLRDDLEELSRQAAYLTTRFNDADTAARERWRLAKVLFFVLSGIWTFLGWFMTKFGPVIFSSLGFGNPGGGR